MSTKRTGSGSQRASIRVRTVGRAEPLAFEVVVQDFSGELRYHVTMSGDDFEGLSQGNGAPEECVRAAFQFLLDHEPKESILRHFDVSVIQRYFPEFRRDFPHYLDGARGHFREEL